MDAIQAPIIPIVGRLIRETPGTISLGQGVVHYGPPPAALDAVAGGARRSRRPTNTRTAPASRRSSTRIARKLAAENGIDVGARRAHHGDGRRQHGVHARGAGDHPARRRNHPAGAVLLQPRDGDRDGGLPRRPGRRPTITISCASTRIARGDHAAHARDRHDFAEQSERRGAVARPSLREVNDLCRERGLYHIADEPYEYFTYGGARTSRRRRSPARTAHTISLYSLSKAYGFAGWRIGYMVYPEHLASAMMKSQDTILICPPIASQVAAVAALEVGRAYCEPHVRELAVDPRHRRRPSCRRSRRWRPCRRPMARSTAC